MPLVLHEAKDGIGTVTLNHPQKRNALCGAMIEELMGALDALRTANVRSVVLRATIASGVWSAGHDVKELPGTGRDPLTYSDPLRRAVRAIESFPTPVLALIEGTVWGSACELALVCDLLVAVPAATFAITPAKLGVPYNVSGMSNFTKTIPLLMLKEMLFTGRPVTARRALAMGMLNHVVEDWHAERFAYELAAGIAEVSPMCVAAMKEELHVLAEASALSPETLERLQSLRRSVYDSRDYQEGIRAFIEKRKPVFTGE